MAVHEYSYLARALALCHFLFLLLLLLLLSPLFSSIRWSGSWWRRSSPWSSLVTASPCLSTAPLSSRAPRARCSSRHEWIIVRNAQMDILFFTSVRCWLMFFPCVNSIPPHRVLQRVWLSGVSTCGWELGRWLWHQLCATSCCQRSGTGGQAGTPCAAWRWPLMTPHHAERTWTWRIPASL